MEPSKKKQYPTSVQKTRLVGLMEADEELRQGKFSASFTKKVAEARWKMIADEINSIPGAKKEWHEWRKCWQDMKSKCKKKNTELRRSQNATGGGPPAPSLSPEEQEILKTISKPVLIGHTDSQESLVMFKDLTIPPPIDRKPILPFEIDLTLTPTAAAQAKLHVHPLNQNEIITEAETLCDAQTSSTIVIPQEKEIFGNNNKENIKSKKTKPQKRLQQSLQIATDFKNAVIEKNTYKKAFYEQYIQEMRRQTDALLQIAHNLNNIK